MQAKILSWSAMPLFSKSTNLHNLWQKLPIHELTFKAKFVNPRSCSPQQTGGNSSYLNFCKIGLRVNLKKKTLINQRKPFFFCLWSQDFACDCSQHNEHPRHISEVHAFITSTVVLFIQIQFKTVVLLKISTKMA